MCRILIDIRCLRSPLADSAYPLEYHISRLPTIDQATEYELALPSQNYAYAEKKKPVRNRDEKNEMNNHKGY